MANRIINCNTSSYFISRIPFVFGIQYKYIGYKNLSYEWENINKYHCENETNNVEYLHNYVFNICAFGKNVLLMICQWNVCEINV